MVSGQVHETYSITTHRLRGPDGKLGSFLCSSVFFGSTKTASRSSSLRQAELLYLSTATFLLPFYDCFLTQSSDVEFYWAPLHTLLHRHTSKQRHSFNSAHKATKLTHSTLHWFFLSLFSTVFRFPFSQSRTGSHNFSDPSTGRKSHHF